MVGQKVNTNLVYNYVNQKRYAIDNKKTRELSSACFFVIFPSPSLIEIKRINRSSCEAESLSNAQRLNRKRACIINEQIKKDCGNTNNGIFNNLFLGVFQTVAKLILLFEILTGMPKGIGKFCSIWPAGKSEYIGIFKPMA